MPLAKLIGMAFAPVYRRLPMGLRRSIRAARHRYLVWSSAFCSDEPEYGRLSEWLEPGDTAIDVGANCGSYTLRMSELVGESGRVIAFEPVPQTFSLLCSALVVRACRNVSALNLACSSENAIVTMSIPDDPMTGENLYQAAVGSHAEMRVSVVCVRLDDLPLPIGRLALVKIDAEGHDANVIEGMWGVIQRQRPVLIVEHPPLSVAGRLAAIGYVSSRDPESPNTVFVPRAEGSHAKPRGQPLAGN